MARMTRNTGLALAGVLAFTAACDPVFAEDQARQPIQPPVTRAAAATIETSGYVRLEVTLTTSAASKEVTFNQACPERSLWGISLKELLAGQEHVTLGVSISAPGVSAIEFKPLAIDKKSSGLFGTNRQCSIVLDEMRYLSPVYYVRRYENQQFTVAPIYKKADAANPGLADTINAATAFALKLSGVPAETAAPYQDQLKTILGNVSVSATETFPKHPVIKPGPVPGDDMFQWRTNGIFKVSGKPVDVILTARLIPVTSLISDPTPGPDGKVRWEVSDVLNSPFAANLAPGANPGGTIGSYLTSTAAYDLANFGKATTKGEASNACDPLLPRVRAMGLSDRDEALLLWAVTHDRPPSALSPYELDHLNCLDAAWRNLPAEISAGRIVAQDPPPATLTPPGLKQMKAATQVDDAFAIFFKTTVWAERRQVAAALFGYPAQYDDPAGLLFDATAKLDNADQWLALHIAATPVADRIGCYAYVPAADASGQSVMYAVADTVAGRNAPQAVLTVTFANVEAGADAKIAAIDVSSTVSAAQKAAITGANGSICSSGYKPALIFGG